MGAGVPTDSSFVANSAALLGTKFVGGWRDVKDEVAAYEPSEVRFLFSMVGMTAFRNRRWATTYGEFIEVVFSTSVPVEGPPIQY